MSEKYSKPNITNSRSRLAYLPIFFAVWQSLGWIGTYLIALHKGHIKWYLPFISHTGVQLPESSLFGIVHSISGIMTGFMMYIRFRQVQLYQPRLMKHAQVLWKLNVGTLIMGEIASVGLFLVAFFPQNSDKQYVVIYNIHCWSAFTNFTLGVPYQFLQSILTRMMHPEVVDIRMFWYRLCISMIGIFGYFTGMVCGIQAQNLEPSGQAQYRGYGTSNMDWQKGSPHYNYLLVFAASEWILAISFVLYFLTFTSDFAYIKLSIVMDATTTTLRIDDNRNNNNVLSAANTANLDSDNNDKRESSIVKTTNTSLLLSNQSQNTNHSTISPNGLR